MKLDKDQQDDPFNFLGFGMVAYRDLMFILIILFSVISIIMIPAMSIYKSHNGIAIPVGYAKMSLGNLGYSSTQC
jgi:hypothetical protein